MGISRAAPGENVGDDAHRGPQRVDVGAARDVFLQDVVLHGAREPREIRALLFRDGDVEREQNRGGRVDGHRRRDALERNAVEKREHVFEGIDGHADFADFSLRQRMIGIHADLRGKIESDGEAGLSLFEQIAIAAIGFDGGAEAGVLAHGPEAAAVHRGIDAARERKLARVAEVALGIESGEIFGRDDGFHRQTRGGGGFALGDGGGLLGVISHLR